MLFNGSIWKLRLLSPLPNLSSALQSQGLIVDINLEPYIIVDTELLMEADYGVLIEQWSRQ